MSYVDAYYDKAKDLVRVVERVDGQRKLIDYKPEYSFYVADPRGSARSIYGDSVTEIRSKNHKDFRKKLSIVQSQ